MLKLASATDPVAATLVNRVTACALVMVWALSRLPAMIEMRVIGPLALASVVAVGVGDAVAELCFASASTHAPLSVVTPLSSLYPAVAVLLTVAILRERVRPLAAAGVCCALVGIVLLSGG